MAGPSEKLMGWRTPFYLLPRQAVFSYAAINPLLQENGNNQTRVKNAVISLSGIGFESDEVPSKYYGQIYTEKRTGQMTYNDFDIAVDYDASDTIHQFLAGGDNQTIKTFVIVKDAGDEKRFLVQNVQVKSMNITQEDSSFTMLNASLLNICDIRPVAFDAP